MTTTTATAPAPTRTTWTVDPAHSHVEFAVRHLMISTVKGRFAEVSGAVQIDDEDPTRSVIDVTIAASSIDTRQPDRDTHLRSADFFDAEQHPHLTFRSTRIDRDGDEFRVHGDLAIRGVTRPVTLRVTEEGRGRDPWGGERVGFSATTKINRRDFGLTWNQVLETGGIAVGDEVKISIDVELVKQ